MNINIYSKTIGIAAPLENSFAFAIAYRQHLESVRLCNHLDYRTKYMYACQK